MAIIDPKNTLAYHQSRVLTTHRDMSQTPCSAVAARVKHFNAIDQTPSASPEGEALWFYGMNHGMALIQSAYAPLQPLAKDDLAFVESYHAKMVEKAVRAFNYLLLICTREFRHNQSLPQHAHKIGQLFGKSLDQFFMSVKGGEQGIKEAFLNNPPAAGIGNYTKALAWGFYNCKWQHGYGGKAWGQVTDCLVRFVTGEFTAEMMLDTIWTLCHNNGPIFNKGFLYSMYSHNLVRILDIQRSGQVLEAILDDQAIQPYADATLIMMAKAVQKRFSGKIGDYVNWDMVEALGSVNKYPNEKEAQHQKFGMTPEAKAAAEFAKQKALEAKAAKQKAAIEHAKNHFTVMPGVEVKKIFRKTAA